MLKRLTTTIMVFIFIFSIISHNVLAFTTLKYGSKGNDVKILQQKLKDYGYFKGTVNGIFGNETKNAVIKYQQTKKLKITGIVEQSTWNLLNKSTSSNTSKTSQVGTKQVTFKILQKGMSGQEVTSLQKKLVELKYIKLNTYGYFGSMTVDAVKAFQKSNNLPSTGIVDKKTWDLLFKTNNEVKTTTKVDTGKQNQTTSPNISNQEQTKPVDTSLKKGSSGEEVSSIQKRLVELKYLNIDSYGNYDENTEFAVMEFQKTNKLPETGIVDNETKKILLSNTAQPKKETPNEDSETKPVTGDNGNSQPQIPITSVLQYGSSGNEVIILQNKLNELGFNCNISGIFEETTLKAVIDFETANGLAADGIASQVVLEKLFSTVVLKENFIQKKGSPGSLIGKIIIIDPGHGFKDPGAANSGVQEKTITLDIGLRLKRILEEAGATVIMTRDTDGSDGSFSLYYRSAVANNQIIELEIPRLMLEISQLEGKIAEQEKNIEDKQKELENLRQLQNPNDQERISNMEIALGEDMIALEENRIKKQEIEKKIDRLNQKKLTFNYYINNPSYKDRYGIMKTTSSNNYAVNKDLVEIFDLAKEKYNNDVVFISIHCNATSEKVTKASGIQVYVQKDNDSYYTAYYKNYDYKSRQNLGVSLLQELNANTNFSKKYTSLYKSNLSVLRENNLASVLVEVGFLNNPDDRLLLTMEQTREDVAFGLYKGVQKYFNIKK